jgi:hypothetical protein
MVDKEYSDGQIREQLPIYRSGEKRNSIQIRNGYTKKGNNNKSKGTTIGGFTNAQMERILKFVFDEFFAYMEKDAVNFRWKVGLYVEMGEYKLDMELVQSFAESFGVNIFKWIYLREDSLDAQVD